MASVLCCDQIVTQVVRVGMDWLLISREVDVCCMCRPSRSWTTSCSCLRPLVIALKGQRCNEIKHQIHPFTPDSMSIGGTPLVPQSNPRQTQYLQSTQYTETPLLFLLFPLSSLYVHEVKFTTDRSRHNRHALNRLCKRGYSQ